MRKIAPLIFCFFFPFLVVAQEKFQGEYTFNGLKGEAIFEFVRGEGNAIIRQGEFKFSRREKDREDRTRINKTMVEGFYDADKKTGLWDYLDEIHLIDLNDVNNFRLDYTINSQQIKLKANYLEGIPHGKWVFEENIYSEGKLSPKSEADEIQFSEGQIDGFFQYKSFVDNRTLFIRGEVSDGGFMNGEWTFVYKVDGVLISEVRNYEKGFLIGLVKRDLLSDEILEERVFFEVINKLNQINNKENKGYRVSNDKFGILFNDAFLSSDPEFISQTSGNAFISEFLNNVLRYDESYVNEEGNLIQFPIHTRRFVYELSRSQQRIIEELPEEYDRQIRVVRDYSNRNSLRINRQRSDSLAFANAYFEFKAEKLKEFDELMDLIKSKRIQFFDVNEMFQRGIPFIREKERIEYTFEDEVKVMEVAYDLSKFETDFYVGLSDYFRQMGVTIRSVKGYVDESLSQIERDDDLRSIENRVQSQKIVLDELYLQFETLNEDQKQIISSVHTNILVNAFENMLQEYARLNLFTDKKQKARVMEDLLEEMSNNYTDLIAIPEFKVTLDVLYQEEVFNPFTFSRYDQRAKPRLYEAGEKLFDHYISSIINEQDYSEIRVLINKVKDLMIRMEELRFADTRRLENRINRRLDVKKIESLLDL
ncbi:hypothetical protein [Cecembia lonarensis]|uniref:MORN repeat variant n=1 Tax=Cecembia lonarensis (strain CCUG 58316 / KCTC 22772 / LW9) TaxID=1225176 RepID=K1LEB0_CECL9|nr:hypothetical protein [Cecembia lonarensis]EKB50522.1 hypothetical protein B879_00904 [Cecembia lonarensis LW9]